MFWAVMGSLAFFTEGARPAGVASSSQSYGSHGLVPLGERKYRNANMSSELNLLSSLRVHGGVPPCLAPLHMSTATEQTPSEADSISANQKHFQLLWKWNVHCRFHNSAL